MRYPFGHEPVAPVTALLDRLDAGPVAGVPVEVWGRVTGRGMPGYVLSPDLVIADDRGFVPLRYTNPLPFGREWFGAVKAGRLVGADVVARGWYFRAPGPVVEVRSLRVLGPPEQGLPAKVRAWGWVTSLALACVVFAIGLALMAAQAGYIG